MYLILRSLLFAPGLLLLTLFGADITTASGGTLMIDGKILNALQGAPLPGCLISIASAGYGRSKSVFSASNGSFDVSFEGSPAATSGAIPYLEIYFDNVLIFRQPLSSLPIERAEPALLWHELLERGGEVTLRPVEVRLP
jgi:hypothetical protein